MDVIDADIAQRIVNLIREAVRIGQENGYANADIDELLHTAVSMEAWVDHEEGT